MVNSRSRIYEVLVFGNYSSIDELQINEIIIYSRNIKSIDLNQFSITSNKLVY